MPIFNKVKKLFSAAFFIMFLLPQTELHSYRVLYAEQFYRLYHIHFYMYPNDYLENIYYLEQALRADFANPLNALAVIKNKEEWERYRYLFRMHVSVKLVELYLGLASKYDKREAYFFNAPWQRENLRSLEVAEETYKYARVYWDEAVKWNEFIDESWITLENIQHWEDQSYRIRENKLNYGAIIDRHLERVSRVKQKFLEMDETTY